MEAELIPAEAIGWRAWTVGGTEKIPLLRSVTHRATYWHPQHWTLATCGGQTVCKQLKRKTGIDEIVAGTKTAQEVLDELEASKPRELPAHSGIPGEHCSCGLYAAKTRAQLVKLGYNREADGPAASELPPILIGEVGLAGKVIEGDQGWKAEKGRIRKLYVGFHHWKIVAPIENLYRVEVVLDNTNDAESLLRGDGTYRTP